MHTTRDRLIAIAAELVDEGGAAAVTMRSVGGRAGFSHNVPYKHFADKRDLLACVAAAELRTLAASLTSAAARRNRAGRVEDAALAYLAWARERPNRFLLVFGPWGTEPHEELGAAAAAATEAMHAAAAAAVKEGLHGDPGRISALVWALAHGAAGLDLTGHLRKQAGGPSPEDLVRDLVAAIGSQ